MTFECSRNEHVTSSSAFSSVCEPVRSKGREPRRAGRLWTPKQGCGARAGSCLPQDEPMDSYYYILNTESLAWYRHMESEDPIGSIPISDLDLDAQDWETPKRTSDESKFCFTIVISEPAPEINQKRHVLCAKEESMANEWLESLVYAYVRCYRRRVHTAILQDLTHGVRESKGLKLNALGPYDPMRIASISDFSLKNFRDFFPLTDIISVAKAETSSMATSHPHRRSPNEIWIPLCKVGPSRSMGRKRSWTRYSVSLNEEYMEFRTPEDWGQRTRLYPKERESNRPKTFRIKIVDIISETIDLVSLKAMKKTPPNSPDDYVKNAMRFNQRPQSCLVFEVRRPVKDWSTQVLCGSRHDHMPLIQSAIKKTTDRASPQTKARFSSNLLSDEEDKLVEEAIELERQGDRSKSPRWSFSVVSNALSRVQFVNLMRDLMQETMPKARLWTWRHVGCPTGCRCPVYVSFYTIQGISTTPDGHVRSVRALCSSALYHKKSLKKKRSNAHS